MVKKKIRDILTEEERLEIARLRILLLNSSSIIEGKRYEKEILEIINTAKKRYFENDEEKKIKQPALL